MKKVVALVGRPNVGKSTLFNKMVGKKISIIEDTPGVTRDRIYSNCTFNDKEFILIDTGGIDLEKSSFNEEIKVQASIAIKEADKVIFVVDGKEGITTNDLVVRDILKKSKKDIIVAINKCDSKQFLEHEFDFYELGFDKYANISGEQNIGIYELLSDVTKDFSVTKNDYSEDVVKFSIIGRPNVGKSTLVNALLNEERVVASNVAGTTRDAIDTPFRYHEKDYVVIDTAGMRKKGKIFESIEKYSLIRTLRAIDRSDVCVIVIDASSGIIEHDKHIAGYAIDAGKAVVLVVNKWDLVEDKEASMKKWKELIKYEFQFMPYVKPVFLSSLTKARIHTLMPEILKCFENSKKEIKTSVLNDVIMEAYRLNLPPSYKGKRMKIYYSTQAATNPPTFNIQVNNKGLLHFSYKRYLENKIRESFDFDGTPIVLNFKNKGEIEQ
ncbi:MAG: ribosome biogenesis GTPase Der [Bacilli bacterium]|nr:ribosome biogenesis GTPase Der [Bacilli bacterium]